MVQEGMVCRNAGELSSRAWGGSTWKEDRGLGDTMCVGTLGISQTSAGWKIRWEKQRGTEHIESSSEMPADNPRPREGRVSGEGGDSEETRP
jgi:hypothetical protein